MAAEGQCIDIYIYMSCIHIFLYDIIRQTATDQQSPFPAAVNCGPRVYHRPEMVGPRHLEPCRVAKKSAQGNLLVDEEKCFVLGMGRAQL